MILCQVQGTAQADESDSIGPGTITLNLEDNHHYTNRSGGFSSFDD